MSSMRASYNQTYTGMCNDLFEGIRDHDKSDLRKARSVKREYIEKKEKSGNYRDGHRNRGGQKSINKILEEYDV